MTSRDYIKAMIVTNLEECLQKKGQKLPSLKVPIPMSQSYVPELDNSEELETYFDLLVPRLDPNMFTGNDAEGFRQQYRDATEEVPVNMPKPRGRPVQITAYVDASHAANKLTRWSHTGFIIFINRAPIIWFSKRQYTVESSTFSSEFIAAKTCTEHIIALRYKLRMLGIPIDGLADILCDNESVVKCSSRIEEAILDKKHSSIVYHVVQWGVAAEVIRIGKIDGEHNLADAMTKRLTHQRREFLFGSWCFRNY